MIDPQQHLVPDILSPEIKREPIRAGFGRGLLEAGKRDTGVVALCADLTESTRMIEFAKEFPDRFVEIGIGEQNLVTVGAGMALAGKIPFVSSYAAFSPGRNWEQIRTTICLNETNVKIVGSHAGVSVGPDGATHQMLEDIALMRVLPHMTVIAPCDAVEAEKATRAMASMVGPAYIRLAREKTPVITTEEAQAAGGLGGLVAETLADHHPVPVSRIGMLDRFGESGAPDELFEYFGLTAPHFVAKALELMKRKGK
jgi:transketolase